jgi:ABC-type Fe3+ transport system substrate-binding protein
MMIFRFLLILVLGGWVGAAGAQTVDPALAASWAFVQQQMGGISYDTLKAACAEGEVMIYHGTWTDAEDAEVAAFRKRFACVRVSLFQLNATPLRSRFQSESHAGRHIADIIQDTDPGTLNDEAAAGLLEKFQVSDDAAYADSVKKSGYWYPLRIALEGIAWNSDLVSDVDAKILQSWQGIVDPRWAGQAGVADPASGGVNYLPWYAWQKLYGDGFFARIGAVHPRVYGGSNQAAAALASGDIAVLFNASETGLVPLLLSGAPIRWSLPEPGIGPVTGQAIAAHAPHPNAAKVFQDFSFSAEGYAAWQTLGGAPARTAMVDARKVAAEPWYKYPTQFLQYDPADASADNGRIIDLFRKTVGAAH